MAQPHPQSKGSVALLEWKIKQFNELLEKHKAGYNNNIKSKIIQIDALQTKVQALKAELKTRKEKEEEQKTKFQLSQEEIKTAVLEKAVWIQKWEESVKKQSKTQLALAQQKHDSEETCKKTVAELEEKHKSDISRMQADHDTRLAEEQVMRQQQTERLTFVEELAKTQAAELEELRSKLPLVENEAKRVVENLRKLLQERDNVIAEENQTKEAMRVGNFIKGKELEMKNEKLNKMIKALKNREDLTGTVSALEETVKDKQSQIGKKNLEMAVLMKEKKQVQEEWAKVKDNNAVLNVKLNDVKDNLKGVEDDLRKIESELEETRQKLNKTVREKNDLSETVTHLKFRVTACEPELRKEKDKNRQLNTHLRRFKEDLGTCMDYTSDPKTFTRKIVDVKRRYVDNDTKVHMDENTETALRYANAVKDQMISSYQRCALNSSKMQRREKKESLKRAARSDQDQSHLVQLNNKMKMEMRTLKAELSETKLQRKMEVHRLDAELNETKRLLLKATKQPMQKGKSWMNTNVPKNTTVVPEDIASSVRACVDDTIPSSLQPHPRSNDNVIVHVIPCVANDLPAHGI